jgi:GDP-L-fucose synthase
MTGASGFLGRFLCAHLVAEGHDVVPLSSASCDLTQAHALNPFETQRFDVIYHLAAWTQAGDFCLHHPGEQWLINQKINTQMLSWWHRAQPQAKLVCMGTSCSYDPLYPLSEEHYLQGTPIESLFTYAMTKRMLLVGLMALHKQFGLDYLYLVPSTLYGPNYHTDGRQLHFIFDVIRKIVEGGPVVLWGDGEQKREIVHVRDFVSALVYLTATQKNTLINIGSGEEYSIKEFARKICAHVGYPFDNIQFDATKYVGARSKVLSIGRLRALMPHYQATPLDQGLQETIAWFCQHKET